MACDMETHINHLLIEIREGLMRVMAYGIATHTLKLPVPCLSFDREGLMACGMAMHTLKFPCPSLACGMAMHTFKVPMSLF